MSNSTYWPVKQDDDEEQHGSSLSGRPQARTSLLRRFRWHRVACVLLPLVALLFLLSRDPSTLTSNNLKDYLKSASLLKSPLRDTSQIQRPYTGAFERFPSLTELSAQEKRITLIATWMHDDFPSYLRQFFYSVQLNADTVDLVFVNRRTNTSRNCINFAAADVDIDWGGNIKVVCMEQDEWVDRHTNYLCSKESGWDCTEQQRLEVRAEMVKRPDERNMAWRPLLGGIFRDLVKADARYWAWIDADSFLGRFTRFPFGVLANSSMISAHVNTVHLGFMTGQLTAFNYLDTALPTAWRTVSTLRTPDHFTKEIAGRHPADVDISEERFWSFHYLGVNETQAGVNLTYTLFADMQGDDNYQGEWDFGDDHSQSQSTYLISGRDILQIGHGLNRRDMETLLALERLTSADGLHEDDDSTGWSGGVDGSMELVHDPQLSPHMAVKAAIDKSSGITDQQRGSKGLFDGLVESVEWQTGEQDCMLASWIPAALRLCLAEHSLSKSVPSILRASLVHFRGQQPGQLLRRLERDRRSQGYSRKLLKHNLHSKRYPWIQFPPNPVTEEHAMTFNGRSLSVWKMGASRDTTLFHRQQDKLSAIG